jgi:nucleoside-diphosphate-sugar epimerase
MHIVTGATGFLGGHLAHQLVQRGEPVRALVRASSDTRRIDSLGVEFAVGDLTDPGFVRDALRDGSVVYHCAAKVGDWGPWSEFESQTVLATRNVVDACLANPIERLVHVSSVAAYGHPTQGRGEVTEASPLGQNLWLWDYYPSSKMAAEAEVRRLESRAVVVRPTWIYGPHDRAVLPRIVRALSRGKVSLIGPGDNLLNMVYVEDVVAGVLKAAAHPQAGGEAYNLCGTGEISQRNFFARLCSELGLPPVRLQAPLSLVYSFAFSAEAACRLIRRKRPPLITRHGASLISRATNVSNTKARADLDWRPLINIDEGLRQTLNWLSDDQAAKATTPVSSSKTW